MVAGSRALFSCAVALALMGCSSDPEPLGAGPATGTGTGTGGAGAGGGGGAGGGQPPAAEDWSRDILREELTFDVATLAGVATITLAPSTSRAASFEIGDLDIAAVEDALGPLAFEIQEAAGAPRHIDVGVRDVGDDVSLTIQYTAKAHQSFDGWLPAQQLSFLWPYFCGNLFPCKSSPADGVRFDMTITGVPGALTAVYPTSIPSEAPSYMPAIAVGQFTKLDLGVTAKGTAISAFHLPGQEADAAAGTANLREVFEFFETTYGDYAFGDSAGAVSADWGPGAYGGMEHHPFFHVASDAFGDPVVHAHEAAHGWFGNGVRIRCWEDFVLSEGTVSYMAARALEQVAVDAWADYECTLRYVCDPANDANTIALPATCDQIDLLNDPLWSSVPYMKGAWFFREVATAIGPDALDAALAGFYEANVGKAAKMQEMIDYIASRASAADAKTVTDLEKAWLLTLECPVDYTTLCP